MSKLSDYRINAGLSQSQLAEKSGVSVRTLQDYEQGRKPIGRAAAETVIKIAKALEISVEDLLNE